MSESVRPSRRQYEGLWFRMFRVRPVRCAACGLLFSIAIEDGAGHLGSQTLDRDLPFQPVELEDSVTTAEILARSRGGGSVSWRQGGVGCPVCRSTAVRSARSGTDRDWKRRFEGNDDYRCLECNAGFKRTSLVRSLVLAVLLMSVLGGLIYLVIGTLDRKRTNASPTLRKKHIPPPPPPVFRKRLEVKARLR
jgi:hypothetical protein